MATAPARFLAAFLEFVSAEAGGLSMFLVARFLELPPEFEVVLLQLIDSALQAFDFDVPLTATRTVHGGICQGKLPRRQG